MAIFLAGGLSLMPAARAAMPDGNPYKTIVDRNPFGLIPPPPPAPPVTNTPPSNIQLTGITMMLGKKMAMMMAQEPGPNKTPQSYMLTEGERDGQIEVLEIDDKAGSEKVNNAGVVQTLTFDKDGAKPSGGGSLPAPGGMPGRSIPAPGAMPGRPGSQPSTGGMRQIPSRDVRPTSAPTTPTPSTQPATTAAAQPAQPAQPAMAPEVQTTMIEVNRVLTQEQVNKGELPPLPPTELTPPEEAAKITTPGPGNPGD